MEMYLSENDWLLRITNLYGKSLKIPKWLIPSRKSKKDSQQNVKKKTKQNNRTNIGLQNTTQN